MLFLVVYLLAIFNKVEGSDELITCASVVKLSNYQDKSRLHSHDVKYGKLLWLVSRLDGL